MLIHSGTMDVTPDVPCELVGFVGGPRIANDVHSPLEVNFVLFDAEPSARVLLVALDVLYAGRVVEELGQRLAQVVPPERIIVAASHTHFAPGTEPAVPGLGRADASYATSIADRISQQVLQCLGSGPGAARVSTLGYGAVRTDHAIGRRRVGWQFIRPDGRLRLRRQMTRRPNPRIPIDDRLKVMLIGRDPVQAVVWSYACHPSQLPAATSISAEFPGVVRERLRRQLGDPAVPVLFLQGFAGDVRPNLTAWFSGQYWTERIENLLNHGPGFAQVSLSRWAEWSEGVAATAVSAMELAASNQLPLQLSYARWSSPRATPDESGLDVARLSFAPQLHLCCVNGEPTSDTLAVVRSQFANGIVVPVGCVDRSTGYLPGRSVIAEGGYEAGGFATLFGHSQPPPGPSVLEEAIAKIC